MNSTIYLIVYCQNIVQVFCKALIKVWPIEIEILHVFSWSWQWWYEGREYLNYDSTQALREWLAIRQLPLFVSRIVHLCWEWEAYVSHFLIHHSSYLPARSAPMLSQLPLSVMTDVQIIQSRECKLRSEKSFAFAGLSSSAATELWLLATSTVPLLVLLYKGDLNLCAIYFIIANFSWCFQIQILAGTISWLHFPYRILTQGCHLAFIRKAML